MKKKKALSLLVACIVAHVSFSQNTPWTGSGNVGIGVNPSFYPLHIKGDGYLLKLESINYTGLLMQNAGSNKYLGIHYATDGANQHGTNSLRFGRYISTGWEANPMIVDLDAPDGTLAVHETGKVGVGTIYPTTKLHVNTTANLDGISLSHNLGNFSTLYSPAMTNQAMNPITVTGDAGIVFGGGSSFDQLNFGFVIAPWRSGESGIRIDKDGNVGVATNDTKGYRFAVNGNAIFTKIKVKTYSTWPDYVFDKDYPLPSLKEVASYIAANNHLPDVPSAAEVAQHGLDVGDNQALLLKKIEELTLYVIDLQKQVDEQRKEIRLMKGARRRNP